MSDNTPITAVNVARIDSFLNMRFLAGLVLHALLATRARQTACSETLTVLVSEFTPENKAQNTLCGSKNQRAAHCQQGFSRAANIYGQTSYAFPSHIANASHTSYR
ncbi:hypothetical protein [Paraburkholderia sp. GAS42]|uniref:hypothetical protein n=1 Tax=Paraburkholderia sp. GAS42 TaxID=3035135 RepID=UPI003D244201